jgi:catechol 2,3-dioxygenase-like lactoylglutathione lyase family enzyme
MKGYYIGGIQQIGIGVKNLIEAWKWYNSMFGVDCRIFDDDSEAKIMLPYTDRKVQSRHAILALNLQGGSGFEIWQYKGREPVIISEQIRIGDLGIIACKMKVKNIPEAYNFYKSHNAALLNEPASDPSGKNTFFLKDPYGNIFQMSEGEDWFRDEKKVSGGSIGILIGVTSIEKSLPVYSGILGYDKVVYDKTGIFTDLAGLPGGEKEVRRVLLKCSVPFAGHFSKMFGQSMVELVSAVGNPGKKIYRGRLWGDPGFIHICFDMRNFDALRKYCEETGFPFTVDSTRTDKGNSFDMGEAAGHFAYIEDPDGVLIEFVETHRIPMLKKLGLYLNLKKRKNYKPLPDWIVKMLRFSRVRP